MLLRRSFIIGVLVTGLARVGFGQVLVGPIVDPANSYRYYLLTPTSWTASQSEAVGLGGNLVTVRNAAENTWITTTFAPYVTASNGDIFSGFEDPDVGDTPGAQHAADFQWIDGEPITYTNWFTGEPNDDPEWGGEYYGTIIVHPFNGTSIGQWNDVNNTGDSPFRTLYGLVEVVPEPMSFGMIGVSMLAATLIRPRRNLRTA